MDIAPVSLHAWIEENKHMLQPPVGARTRGREASRCADPSVSR